MNIKYKLTQGPHEAQLYIDKCMLIRNNIVRRDCEFFPLFFLCFFFLKVVMGLCMWTRVDKCQEYKYIYIYICRSDPRVAERTNRPGRRRGGGRGVSF